MRVLVITTDPAFFTVAHGLAGAMGYVATRVTALGTMPAPAPDDLVVLDFGRLPPGELPPTDLLRTVVFVGAADEPMARARAASFGAVYARASLATELPRLIADFAV